MLEMLKLNTSCVFSSFDKTRCKIYDILCNVVFHGSTSMNKSTNISIEIGIFFFFFSLNQKFRCVYTKEESKEIDFIPSKRFLVEKKKKIAALYIYYIYNALYSAQTFVQESGIFGIRWIFLARQSPNILVYNEFRMEGRDSREWRLIEQPITGWMLTMGRSGVR